MEYLNSVPTTNLYPTSNIIGCIQQNSFSLENTYNAAPLIDIELKPSSFNDVYGVSFWFKPSFKDPSEFKANPLAIGNDINIAGFT